MNQSLIPTNPTEVKTIAQSLAQSGYFKDASDVTKAFVKVLAGAELGIPAFQSMSGVHIIQGKPSLSSGLMASLIKRSGRYNYRVVEHTAEVCRIEFTENGQLVGESEMTMKEAKAANLHQEWDRDNKSWKDKVTWKNFPKNMLFNRALSNGAKWHCPDIFGGPVYIEGEIDEAPAVVETTAEVVHEAKVTQSAKPKSSTGKRATAEAMKTYQETGSLPPDPEAQFVFDRIDEFSSNIQRAQDDASWDFNEQLIVESQIPVHEQVALIKQSIIHRIGKVENVEMAEVVKKRIAGFAKFMGEDNVTAVLGDLIDQAKANGMDYVNKKFVAQAEPSNEEMSHALAENG